MTPDRRHTQDRRGNPHHLAVHLVKDTGAGLPLAGRLEVRCACGLVVGGKRFADRTVVTLSDLPGAGPATQQREPAVNPRLPDWWWFALLLLAVAALIVVGPTLMCAVHGCG